MSDNLVKRLRDLGDHASFEPHMHHTAADRIEELEAACWRMKEDRDMVIGLLDSDKDRADAAEAKLEKSLEALATIMCNCVGDAERCGSKAAIAELTGGKDD